MLVLINRNFKHTTIPTFVALYKLWSDPIWLLLPCLVALQKRRYRSFRGYRKEQLS